MLGTPQVHGLMSAAALVGPGREVLAVGWRSALAGSPDMNTLVGLGASAAFGVSCVAAALPALRWRTFFEEPAMLLGVVLLGRTLERRAKLQASADMAALRVRPHPTTPPVCLKATPLNISSTTKEIMRTAICPAGIEEQKQKHPHPLVRPEQQRMIGTSSDVMAVGRVQGLLPATVRLAVANRQGWKQVPAEAVAPGALLVVLPGDRLPVDGTVIEGTSTLDESALTGEPLPVTRGPGQPPLLSLLNVKPNTKSPQMPLLFLCLSLLFIVSIHRSYNQSLQYWCSLCVAGRWAGA